MGPYLVVTHPKKQKRKEKKKGDRCVKSVDLAFHISHDISFSSRGTRRTDRAGPFLLPHKSNSVLTPSLPLGPLATCHQP